MASTALVPYQVAGRVPARIPPRRAITTSVQKKVSFKTPRVKFYRPQAQAGMFTTSNSQIQYMSGYQFGRTRRIFLGSRGVTKFALNNPGVFGAAAVGVAGGLAVAGYKYHQNMRYRKATGRLTHGQQIRNTVQGRLKATPGAIKGKAQQRLRRRPVVRMSGSSTNYLAKKQYARFYKARTIVRNPRGQRPSAKRLAMAGTVYAGGRVTSKMIKNRSHRGGGRGKRTRRDSRGRYAGSY